MRGLILGWDVGGANVKAALVDCDCGSASTVVERPFALWREPASLPAVLVQTAARVGTDGRSIAVMAVTMTAELADCFSTKGEGVAFVLDAFGTAFPGVSLRVYGVDGAFLSVSEARQRPLDVAAANWRASATLVARTCSDALFLDVGSTTTDIIPVLRGSVAVCGRTDPARLCSGELVYTGALRTPVCAIVRSVPFRGSRCRVAAEHFAVAADVHRWLGRIEESDYTCETPDGRGRSRSECGARLARVIAADLEMLAPADITALAEHVAHVQVTQITSGIRQVLRRLGSDAPRVAVVAGHGAFIATTAAQACGLTSRSLSSEVGDAAARAAPAAAVAILLAEVTELRTKN